MQPRSGGTANVLEGHIGDAVTCLDITLVIWDCSAEAVLSHAVDAIRIEIHKARRELEVHANLAAHWRQLEKWWGFREKISQPFGENTFWCSIEMVLWDGSDDLCRNAIRMLRYPASICTTPIRIADGELSMTATLDNGWGRSRRGHPMLRHDLQIPLTKQSLWGEGHPGKTITVTLTRFRLQITLMKLPPRSMLVADEYEYGDGRSLPGGLPGTNRRH